MTDSDTLEDTRSKQESQPTPDPAMQRLERLVGTWRLVGRPVGAKEDSINGTATFSWLHKQGGGPGFFLQQDLEMDYGGTEIKSHELIGYNPATKAFSSHVFSNMAPDPWPYEWDIQGDRWTISIKHGPMNASFTGHFASDDDSFEGSWRPNPGADEEINAPYDVRGTRVG